MEFVEIRHPDVEGTALVPSTSLRQHARAGWSPVADAADVNPPAADAADEDPPTPAGPQGKARRGRARPSAPSRVHPTPPEE